MVFQSYALYPHMTVRQNIGLPLELRRLSAWQRVPVLGQLSGGEARRGIAAEVTRVAGTLALEALLDRRPSQLSGGQRQRVALARVILKDAPILILDEATSALDSEVEAAIQDTLYGVMKGKTVIAIAHRLSTIAAMDRIVVLEDGRIEEQGSHAELLAKNGLYARFWARQSGGFIGIEDAAE
jgi:ABC-type multidrug transport system fused ATPase/permease subunit